MNLGEQKMAWAWAHLPVLRKAVEDVRAQGSFAGKRIAICLHLEAKTACLAWALHEAGAQVYVTGSNPLSTQDDVAEALRARGVQVFGFHGVDESGYHEALLALADAHPQLLIDDGGDLVHLLHEERAQQVPEVIGGCEETTTGILRLLARQAAQALRFPMMAVNDAKMKRLFDNRYGTGQSAWDGVLRTTNLTIAGSTVVVAGYGFVGRGIAERARGLGARVIVCEVDPIAALEAVMEGFLVMPMLEAAPLGDFFITATGMRDVIGEEVLLHLKEGAVLANAGHFNVEIDTQALQQLAMNRANVRPNIEAYQLKNGQTVYLLAEGRLVNLAAADGHPIEIMDLSFAVQTRALAYVATQAKRLKPALIPVPDEMNERIARDALEARRVRIDQLSSEQMAYRNQF